MSEKALSNPTIEINDDVIAYIPNSLSYKPGLGDRKAKAQSSGGNAISIVVTEDAETKVSSVKFKMFNTEANLTRVKDWNVLSESTIRIFEGDITESFRDMIMTTEPERAVGADGELELEWMGAPSL